MRPERSDGMASFSDQPPNPIEAIEAFLREDARFEPPAEALARAMALRTRVAARRAQSPALLAQFGEWMDLAGARTVEWLGLAPHDALAGIRDDRGGETVESPIVGSDLTLVAERVVGEDGVARFIGEFRQASGASTRGRIAVLDGERRVLLQTELDAFGMFAVTLPSAARHVVFLRRGAEEAPIAIDLGDRRRGDA